jgi:hypothetical protein
VQFDELQSVKFAEGNGRKGSRGSLDLTRLDLNLNHLYNEHRVLIERHAHANLDIVHSGRACCTSMHAYTAVLYCKFRETLSCISPRSSITDRECAYREWHVANLDVHSGRTSTLLTAEEVRTRGNRSDGAC